MKRLSALAAIAAIFLIGVACSPSTDGIFPMTVGSVWNMDVVALSGDTLSALDTTQTGTVITTAARKVNLASGEEVVEFRDDYTVHLRNPDSTSTGTLYAYFREQGGYVLRYTALDDSIADTLLMTEPSVGRTWHSSWGTCEVIGQEDVTVAAGTYKGAWKVRWTNGSGYETYYWYARGVGYIDSYFDIKVQNHRETFSQELTSATVK
jgi:hypothetical protein